MSISKLLVLSIYFGVTIFEHFPATYGLPIVSPDITVYVSAIRTETRISSYPYYSIHARAVSQDACNVIGMTTHRFDMATHQPLPHARAVDCYSAVWRESDWYARIKKCHIRGGRKDGHVTPQFPRAN